MEKELRNRLSEPFPKSYIRQRKGSFGKTRNYLAASAVIERLNECFENEWTFVIVQHEVLVTGEGLVHGRLAAMGISKTFNPQLTRPQKPCKVPLQICKGVAAIVKIHSKPLTLGLGVVVSCLLGSCVAPKLRPAQEGFMPGPPMVVAPPAVKTERQQQTAATAAVQSSQGKAGVEWIYSKPAKLYFSKTEITLGQFKQCVSAGKCKEENRENMTDNPYCNWGYSGRDNHPINCVDWNGAKAVCEWLGARLPTEDEWYAEASNGGDSDWPWGDSPEVSCDYAIWGDGSNSDGCGKNSTWQSATWPVCSKTKGNSISGLCDMSGNVWEWTNSKYDTGYNYNDGYNWMVARGGSWWDDHPDALRASLGLRIDPLGRYDRSGVRCVRGHLLAGGDVLPETQLALAATKAEQQRLAAAEAQAVVEAERQRQANTTASANSSTGKAGVEWIYSKPAKLYFTKSEVTVGQFRQCVSVGKCTARSPIIKSASQYCNWGYSDRDNHPINCVWGPAANDVCAWLGGRLPTEDEWYAEASNSGDRDWPWGDSPEVSCDYAIWGDGSNADGCGKSATWPVCSKTKGNSISGLCDMSGNVWEWTSTVYDSSNMVVRGGSWVGDVSDYLRASFRFWWVPGSLYYSYGVRCVR